MDSDRHWIHGGWTMGSGMGHQNLTLYTKPGAPSRRTFQTWCRPVQECYIKSNQLWKRHDHCHNHHQIPSVCWLVTARVNVAIECWLFRCPLRALPWCLNSPRRGLPTEAWYGLIAVTCGWINCEDCIVLHGTVMYCSTVPQKIATEPAVHSISISKQPIGINQSSIKATNHHKYI